jgi:hypothetical protein
VNAAWSRTISPLLKKIGDRLARELDLKLDISPYTNC